jgi:hypothetical protein
MHVEAGEPERPALGYGPLQITADKLALRPLLHPADRMDRKAQRSGLQCYGRVQAAGSANSADHIFSML